MNFIRFTMKNITLKIALFAICCFCGTRGFAQSLSGTTWSYSERLFGVPNVSEVTSYFTFTSSTEVIWLFQTPDNHVFPIAPTGTYNATTHKIVFKTENETITFDFIPQSSQQAKMTCRYEGIKHLYNSGNSFIVNKERLSLQPNTSLVGTSWQTSWMVEQYGKEPYPQYEYMYFKSKHEVLVGGHSWFYVCIGNNVALIGSLNSAQIGTYNPQRKTISFCKDGIYGCRNYDTGTFQLVE